MERRDKMKTRGWKRISWIRCGFILLALLLVTACALPPVREVFKVDESLPIGGIQGDSFVGQRYPFRIKIPAGWQATTQYPEFLVEQGYGLEGLKATPVLSFSTPRRNRAFRSISRPPEEPLALTRRRWRLWCGWEAEAWLRRFIRNMARHTH